MGIGTVNPNIPSSMAGYQKLFNYQPGASLRAWSDYFSHSIIRTTFKYWIQSFGYIILLGNDSWNYKFIF
jgi:hypothetical protein